MLRHLAIGMIGAGLCALSCAPSDSTTPVSAAEGTTTSALATSSDSAVLNAANPIAPLPQPPLGISGSLADLAVPPTPETVRLGRWLFFDPRLSADDTISCATCHRPENAFSEPTAVSTGIDGQKGGRKAPSFLNQAWTIYPHFFWDGRAASLEEQAGGPIINPIEMGMADHETAMTKLRLIKGYEPFFAEAFGDPAITIERVTQAMADYERTRMSGNSPWDRWQAEPDADDPGEDDGFFAEETTREYTDGKHVSAQVKQGYDLFQNKAVCNQCHLGENFTDSLFHNLGVGYDAETGNLADEGRSVISGNDEDLGTFKTPGLRDLAERAPYMHDGSHQTLREVVELYNRGGNANPSLSPKITALDLTEEEVAALVAFMEALDGEGYEDTAPAVFPR
jgi:cytochrome c peroxidase